MDTLCKLHFPTCISNTCEDFRTVCSGFGASVLPSSFLSYRHTSAPVYVTVCVISNVTRAPRYCSLIRVRVRVRVRFEFSFSVAQNE
jgi:hypothetical protein